MTLACAALLRLATPQPATGYAVLAHEAIIDVVWASDIRPLLLKRFPQATKEELRGAHAYAYGGAIIQDLGYYPYGSTFFSDLTHYVRSGDFIEALLRDAQDLNEYAFAIGSLAHYAADNEGHRLGTNLAVPLLYPKLKKKYGDVITYEEDPLAHIKTEFGFDVLEVAQGRFAPDAYHDFIGFEVAGPLLERAFEETYGLELKMVLKNEEKALNSYRHDVSSLIPKATKIAWEIKEDEIKNDLPGITREKFLFNLSRASYEKKWGKDYRKPNFAEKFFALLFRLIPKWGPLKVLTFVTPTPETEKLFEASFNSTLDRYRGLLAQLAAGKVDLLNDNFDVGEQTGPGKYELADEAYAKLLDRLAKQNFAKATPELRAEILRYYSDPDAPNTTKRKPREWTRVQKELRQLKGAGMAAETAGAGPAP